MRRYRFLRALGCDPLASGVVAFLNSMVVIPDNEIHFLTLVIEMSE